MLGSQLAPFRNNTPDLVESLWDQVCPPPPRRARSRGSLGWVMRPSRTVMGEISVIAFAHKFRARTIACQPIAFAFKFHVLRAVTRAGITCHNSGATITQRLRGPTSRTDFRCRFLSLSRTDFRCQLRSPVSRSNFARQRRAPMN